MAQEKVTATLTKNRIAKLKKSKFNADGKYDGLPNEDITATIIYNFGDDPMDAVDRFTEKVVMSFISGHCLFSLQEKIRSLLQQGFTDDEIQAKIYDPDEDEYIWKPGVAAPRKTIIEQTAARLNKLDPEAKARAIANLRATLDAMEE